MFIQNQSLKKFALATLMLFVLCLGFTMPKAQAQDNVIKAPIVDIFQFDTTALSEILRMISELTGQNVVATPEIQNMPITIFLTKITPLVALEVICKNYNLWFSEQNNVIRVMRVEEYGRELTLRRDERTRVYDLRKH